MTDAEYVRNTGFDASTTEGETVRIIEKIHLEGDNARDTQVLVAEGGRYFSPTAGMKVEEVELVGDEFVTVPVTVYDQKAVESDDDGEAERLAAEKAEADRVEAEKADAERLAFEKAAAEQYEAEQAAAEALKEAETPFPVAPGQELAEDAEPVAEVEDGGKGKPEPKGNKKP